MKKEARNILPIIFRASLSLSLTLNRESIVPSCTRNEQAMIKDPPNNASDVGRGHYTPSVLNFT